MALTKYPFTFATAPATIPRAVIRTFDGKAWNGSALEAYLTANYATYSIALTQLGSSPTWVLTVPAGLPVGSYQVVAYTPVVSGTPVEATDTPTHTGQLDWNGTNIFEVAAVPNGPRTWYVASGGSDSNVGNQASPLLTIAAAITAATAGDTIHIGTGTWPSITVSKSLTIEGEGMMATIISSNIQSVIIVTTHNVTIRNLGVLNANGQYTGISASDKYGLTVEKCNIVAGFDAIYNSGSIGSRFIGCMMSSTYDTLTLQGSIGFLVEGCYISCDGSYATNIPARGIHAESSSNGTVRNSTIIINRANAATLESIGVESGYDPASFGSAITLANVVIKVTCTNASATGKAYGVKARTNDTTYRLAANIIGGVIEVTNAGSTANDAIPIDASVSGSLVEVNCTKFDLASCLGAANIFDTAAIATAVNTKIGTPAVSVSADIATRLPTSGYTAPPTVAAIEAALVNEGDATALLTAIADKISADLTAGDLTALAIAAAVRTNLATELARIDAAISSVGGDVTVPTEEEIAAAVRVELATELGRIDATISSRQDTVAFPANFASLFIDSNGRIDLGYWGGDSQTSGFDLYTMLFNMPRVLLSASVVSATTQTELILNVGFGSTDLGPEYLSGQIVVLRNTAGNGEASVRKVVSFNNVTKLLTIDSPPEFTVVPFTSVRILPHRYPLLSTDIEIDAEAIAEEVWAGEFGSIVTAQMLIPLASMFEEDVDHYHWKASALEELPPDINKDISIAVDD